MKELGDRIPQSEKTRVEDAIKKLRESLGTEDVSRIRADFESLQTLWSKISQELYKATQEAGSTAETTKDTGKGTDKGPEDTDYEVVE